MRCAVGIALQRDGGYGDDRGRSKPPFEFVISRLAFSQAKPPAVIMDHDLDVLWIVQGRGAALERRIIKAPFRRSGMPDELCEIVPVFLITFPAAFGGKVVLIPPLELSLWRQRRPACLLAADQVTAHRHHGLAALRPQRRDYVGGTSPPVTTCDDRLLDFKGIH